MRSSCVHKPQSLDAVSPSPPPHHPSSIIHPPSLSHGPAVLLSLLPPASITHPTPLPPCAISLPPPPVALLSLSLTLQQQGFGEHEAVRGWKAGQSDESRLDQDLDKPHQSTAPRICRHRQLRFRPRGAALGQRQSVLSRLYSVHTVLRLAAVHVGAKPLIDIHQRILELPLKIFTP